MIYNASTLCHHLHTLIALCNETINHNAMPTYICYNLRTHHIVRSKLKTITSHLVNTEAQIDLTRAYN